MGALHILHLRYLCRSVAMRAFLRWVHTRSEEQLHHLCIPKPGRHVDGIQHLPAPEAAPTTPTSTVHVTEAVAIQEAVQVVLER